MGGRAILVALIIVLMVGGLAYYINQRQQASSALDTITSLAQIEDVSATECTYPIGSYGSGSQGQLFIYDNKLRVAISQLDISNFSGVMNAVVSPDGTRIVDPTSLQIAGGSTQQVAQILNTLITQAPWKCSPWWFPDASEFTIQGGASF